MADQVTVCVNNDPEVDAGYNRAISDINNNTIICGAESLHFT